MDDDLTPDAERSRFWTRGRTALLGGGLALAVLVAAGSHLTWRERTTSPVEALTGIASSAMRGDADSVAASIDTTSIVDAAVEDILSESDEQRLTLLADYRKTHPETTDAEIKVKARALVNEEIREHVKAGTLPRRIPLGSRKLKALVAEAMARRSIRSVKVNGDVAHVVATVPFRGRTLTVKVRLRRSGESWKVDRIENMASVLKQAGY